MDKTKEAKNDSPQESGKARTGEPGSTPAPETYSKTQVEEAIQKDRIQRGRDAKSFEARETAIKASEDAAKIVQEEKDAAELLAVQSDPDKLAAYNSAKAARERKKVLDNRETAISLREAEAEVTTQANAETELEIGIFEIAKAEDLDPVKLKATMAQLNLTTVEQAKVLAGKLSGKEPLEPDNAMTAGVRQDWSELSPDEKIRRGTTSKK